MNKLHVCYLILFTVASPTVLLSEELSRVEVAAVAKASTVQIDQNGSRIASGFCVNKMGMIICANDTIPENGNRNVLSVVFNAGLKNERVSQAKVIRRDKERNLALLRVENGPELPALTLGMEHDLGESTELIAAGFPFNVPGGGEADMRVLNVKIVNVTKLSRDEKAAIRRVNFDPSLDAGFAGGPLLSRTGKVAGVVGRLNSVSDYAIPVSHLRQFLERPNLAFIPPIVEADRQTLPAIFRVTASQFTDEPLELEVELVLTLEGSPARHFPMKKVGLEFLAEAVPFPNTSKPPPLQWEVRYAGSQHKVNVQDREVQVGDTVIKLSDVASFKNGPHPEIELKNGQMLSGQIGSMGSSVISRADRKMEIALNSVTEMKALPQFAVALHCEIIASKKGGLEMGRVSHRLFLHGTPRANLDAIKEEKYLRPLESGEPTNYFTAISPSGELNSPDVTLNHQGEPTQISSGYKEIQIFIDDWRLSFGMPRNDFLHAGEFRAKQAESYRGGRLAISGPGRRSSDGDGSFVIWELEMDKKTYKIARLAVDFFHRCKETGRPFYGMLRINSTLE